MLTKFDGVENVTSTPSDWSWVMSAGMTGFGPLTV